MRDIGSMSWKLICADRDGRSCLTKIKVDIPRCNLEKLLDKCCFFQSCTILGKCRFICELFATHDINNVKINALQSEIANHTEESIEIT